jgi:outer membrane beta-barrel protein
VETWIRSVFLGLALITACSLGLAQELKAESAADDSQASAQSVIQPDLHRREMNEADIDSENFELGLYVGIISIEDFSSSAVIGARAAYHINEDFFVEAIYGQARAGETSFEILSGGSPFLTDDERDFRYYNLSAGYNLNGEVFLSQDLVFNSATYFTLGVGSTEFGGDEHFTLSIGGGYRLLLTDYMALHFDVRDQIFNSEIIGQQKSTHNIEYAMGATFFF